MCEHTSIIEKELIKANIRETYRGKVWSKNCREWIYFDCVLDTQSLAERLKLTPVIQIHTNNDIKSGLEHGFVCTKCHDAVMGSHPKVGREKRIVK